MARGVAVPEARQQLFTALERVLAAEGPLTSRAVTQEAGVATGLLFTHFRTFDNFLQGYAVDRSFQLAGALGDLTATAGTGTVAGNLVSALRRLPMDGVRALTRLLAARPSLIGEVERILGAGSAGARAVERVTAEYLATEQRRGRVPAEADAAGLALALAGVVQHVALTDGTAGAGDRIRRAVLALTPATVSA